MRAGTLVFAEVDLTKPIREIPPISGIEAREVFVGDARLFDDSGPFLERMSRGDRCFLAVESATGRLTNYRWITTSPTHIPELNRYRYLVPEANTVYAYDLVTSRTRTRMVRAVLRYCAAHGTSSNNLTGDQNTGNRYRFSRPAVTLILQVTAPVMSKNSIRVSESRK